MRTRTLSALGGLLVGLVAGGATHAVQAQQRTPLAELDERIQDAMRQWDVPGVAIAVVKDDSVVLARGYGVRELGRPEPVDSATVFGIVTVVGDWWLGVT